jgi:hypothetical protein
MLCFTVGLKEKIRDKEAQLRDQGYRAVVGPEILPMQYQMTSESMLGSSIYRLTWNEPDTANTAT